MCSTNMHATAVIIIMSCSHGVKKQNLEKSNTSYDISC